MVSQSISGIGQSSVSMGSESVSAISIRVSGESSVKKSGLGISLGLTLLAGTGDGGSIGVVAGSGEMVGAICVSKTVVSGISGISKTVVSGITSVSKTMVSSVSKTVVSVSVSGVAIVGIGVSVGRDGGHKGESNSKELHIVCDVQL